MKPSSPSWFSFRKLLTELSVMIAMAEGSGFRARYADGILSTWKLTASSRGTSEAESQSSRPQNLVCRLTRVDIVATSEMTADPTHQVEHGCGCIPIINNMESDELYTITLPGDIAEAHSSSIAEGTVLVTIHGATVTNSKEVHWHSESSVHVMKTVPHRLRHLQELPSTTGTRYIYVVRVSTVDSVPTKSLEQLKSGMFNASTVSFSSQFTACSFRKLQWKLAGGIDVKLEQSIQDFARPSELLDAAMEAAKAKLAVEDMRTVADHIVFCQPPGGTIDWIASAAVNHWLVNIQNDYCLSLSVLMHEVGHNLGLLHSALRDSAYGDTSGYLGYGARSETWPQKCFNAVKSWQLGWYQDRHLKVNDPDALAAPVTLAAFVDYQETSPDEPVIINIADRYFLMYNRAKSFNANTQVLRDEVTVTEKSPTRSVGLAGLKVGDSFHLPDFRPGMTLMIEVCAMQDFGCDGGSASVESMIVSIALDRSLCDDYRLDATPCSLPPGAPDKPNCLGLHEFCTRDSDCCGPDLRCLHRTGAQRCRSCRAVGQPCSDPRDCCAKAGGGAGNSSSSPWCDLESGMCRDDWQVGEA